MMTLLARAMFPLLFVHADASDLPVTKPLPLHSICCYTCMQEASQHDER